MEEEEFEFDYTNAEAVMDFLSASEERNKAIADYALEYEGSDEGRDLRDNQIGKREDYRQGNKNVTAERLKVQYQKKIVNTAVSFLFGDAPDIRASDMDNANAIEILRVYKANRIHNKLQDFAEAVMSTTIGVFIFSKVKGEGGEEIKARFFNHENGNYTPQYDVYGDLIAFYWEFEIDEIKHIWIFTNTDIHKYADEKYVNSEAHDFGVIPVVFVDQKEPEWWEVKEMIDRLEMLISKLAGSNNYFAFPILKLKGGTVKNEDGEDENLLDISKDGNALLLGHAIREGNIVQADAEFLQRDTGVQSIELEKKVLLEFIHSISQTPNLSFDNVKGIGAISSKALVLMLQDAINKAKRKKGDYETAISRILSIIKNGLGITDDELTFEIEFNLSIPTDEKEVIDMLYNATGGKATISQESAIQQNPLVKDPSEELIRIQAEEARSLGETQEI